MAGFEALATTSAGYAFSKGQPDNAIDRDAMLDHIAREGPLTEDEKRMVLEAVDLEVRVSIVLAALSRLA